MLIFHFCEHTFACDLAIRDTGLYWNILTVSPVHSSNIWPGSWTYTKSYVFAPIRFVATKLIAVLLALVKSQDKCDKPHNVPATLCKPYTSKIYNYSLM